jgi:hypothetical protein
MSHELLLHPGRPVLQTTLGPKIEPGDVPALVAETIQILNALDHPVFNLVDAITIRLDLGDILEGVSLAARGDGPSLHHPNIIETIIVSRDSIIAAAVKGMNTPTFGNLRIKVFSTMEQALAYVDAQPSG